jgi:penicillin-binding protein 1A
VAAALVLLVPAVLWRAFQGERAREYLRSRVADALAARLPSARLDGGVRVDWTFHLVAGPVVVPARERGAPPVLTIERITVRPRLAALLAGRLEAAEVALDRVRVEAGARGEALSDLAAVLGAPRGPSRSGPPAAPPDVAFSNAVVRFGLAHGPRALVIEVGPLSGSARVEHAVGGAAGATAHVALRFPGKGRGEAELRWGDGPTALAVRLRRLGPEVMPAALRARLPFEVTAGALDLAVDAPDLGSGAAGEARVEASLKGVTIRSERLAPSPVGPIALGLRGTARWSRPERRVALAGARLDLGSSGRAAVALDVEVVARPEPLLALDLRAESLDWEAMIAALPPALAPPPEAPAVQGTLAGRLTIAGPLRQPSAWRIEGALDTRGLAPAPERAATLALGRSFTWPAPGGRDVVVGPENPLFVPLSSLPAHVVRAVTTSEDAGFFAHHGFDLGEIRDALAHAGARPRLRGASTITQQLAKNLFLSPERTLARKGREALATLALEASLGKRRLLEIYLNVAEWGPGVFGIGEAARHWFGRDARDLTPKEAAFLASVLPNPVRYEMYRRRGALTDAWEEHVRALLVKLRAAEVLTDEQFFDAWAAPLAFAHG